MRVLVTGAKGQLGHNLIEVLTAHNVTCCGVGKDELDVTDFASVSDFVKSYHPSTVVHSAAYTAVDKAETEVTLCEKVNVCGTFNIAKACASNDVDLAYISTDYVFPGTGQTAYQTNDPTGPLNVYGRTKLQGEIAIQSLLKRFFIIRTSWVYGGSENDFVRKILCLASCKNEISVVDDQIGSPTYTRDLAELIYNVIATRKYGIYHATNEGYCSRADLARKIIALAHLDCKVTGVSTKQYHSVAMRPLNSRLSKDSLDVNSFSRLPEWDDALKRYMKKLLVRME